MQVPLFQLKCGVNSYEWGKKGQASAAARFAAASPADPLAIEPDKPYAELWMGTHPSNPSKDLTTGRTLVDLLEANKALVSTDVSARYGNKLPFLFKVLSIDKALSIQAHPNKKLAQQLHARDPKNYPDDNHKPEMAIAITPFEGLCGFRPLAEVAKLLAALPPLRRLVGEDRAQALDDALAAATDGKKALRGVFDGLMSSSTQDLERELPKLVALAKDDGASFAGGGIESASGSTLAELVTRLHAEFGNDIGIAVLFLLNYVRLAPGEALFLKADDIHAYLSGDIIECMAASDNVVRAGLTPKFKDVKTLVDMLTYNYAPIEEQKMEAKDYPYVTLDRKAYSSNSSALLYDPPIDEFAVVRTLLNGDEAKATFEGIQGPSIFVCTKGKGTIAVGHECKEVREGYVFFVGATAEVVLKSGPGVGSEDEFITFRAFCEVNEASDGQRL